MAANDFAALLKYAEANKIERAMAPEKEDPKPIRNLIRERKRKLFLNIYIYIYL